MASNSLSHLITWDLMLSMPLFIRGMNRFQKPCSYFLHKLSRSSSILTASIWNSMLRSTGRAEKWRTGRSPVQIMGCFTLCLICIGGRFLRQNQVCRVSYALCGQGEIVTESAHLRAHSGTSVRLLQPGPLVRIEGA